MIAYAEKLSEYTISPVYWAVANSMLQLGLIKNIRPSGEATRGELFRVITVFDTLINE